MDGNGSYSLIACPPDQGALVPVQRIVVGGAPFDEEAETDFVDRLQ